MCVPHFTKRLVNVKLPQTRLYFTLLLLLLLSFFNFWKAGYTPIGNVVVKQKDTE